jgi:hypothetical protein
LIVFLVENQGVEGFTLFRVVVDAGGEVRCVKSVFGLEMRTESA